MSRPAKTCWQAAAVTVPPSLLEIFLVALRLGCTSFGGPVAHLAFFRDEYVVRRRWLDEQQFADLVALCQFLPGPASSQTGFGVGFSLRGVRGGVLAWLGFTLPSAILMIGFAYGVTQWGDGGASGWLRGLKAAAVAVVAHAVWSMGRTLCPDWPRRVLALGVAVASVAWPTAWMQMAAIAGGALVGVAAFPAPAGVASQTSERGGRIFAWLCLGVFSSLLLVLPLWAAAWPEPHLILADRFYRVGALVFGGGHTVLPLLEREVVAASPLTHGQFLAGYGAAQALPGPLFAFSAYLGTLLQPGHYAWLGGVGALLAIFLPALLLVAGALPFWQSLRHEPRAQAALRGANAAVVGILLAAFYSPVCTTGLTSGKTLAVAIATLAGLVWGRLPVWAWVGLAALAGAAWL